MFNNRLSKGLMFSLACAVFWAMSMVVNRYMQKHEELTGNMIFWTALIALPYWIIRFKQEKIELRKYNSNILGLIIVVGIGSLIIRIVDVSALNFTTATNLAFYLRSAVIFTIIFEFLILKTPITRKKRILAVAIMIGIYLVIIGDKSLTFNFGDMLAIIEGLIIGLSGNVISKLLVNQIGQSATAITTIILANIFVLIFALFTYQITLPIFPLFILVSATLNIAITVAKFLALREVSPTFATMVVSLTPLFAVIFSYIFLGETITMLQGIGGIIIISAVFIVEKVKLA